MSDTTTDTADFLIIGGGIAGASVGYWLSAHGRVLILESEAQPGYHSTGRSAALFMEGYGSAQVRALTRASRAFFEAPPDGFGEHPLLSQRGALFVAGDGQAQELEMKWRLQQVATREARLLAATEACELVSVLRRDRVLGAVHDPSAVDIDVHALHRGYLRGIRRQGGVLRCHAEVTELTRLGGVWRVLAGDVIVEAPRVINAAGAWADVVADRAGVQRIGLQPRRRSAFTFKAPAGVAVAAWPLTIGVAEDWYFKPEAGQLLGSPANVDPTEPQDVQPEELDVAIAVNRIEAMTTLSVGRPTRTWAGLRSFVADGGLVGGFDETVEGFFWLAAQGGYGIQTSAAMGQACASLARGAELPESLRQFGLDAAMLAPGRLRRVAGATPR